MLRKQSTSHHPFFSHTQLNHLKALTSSSPLSEYTFLSQEKLPVCHTPQDAYGLEMSTVGLSNELAAHNPDTHNLTHLIHHLIELLNQLQVNYEVIPIETYNTLFLVRIFVKQFAGNMTHTEIIHQLEDNQCEELMDKLIYLLCNMDSNVNYSMYEFYVEILNMFIVLLSTQLHSHKLCQDDYFLNILLNKFHNRAESIVAKLLENIIEQKTAPVQSSNVMFTAYNYFFATRHNSHSDIDITPVSDRSLLLLLLLGMQSSVYTEWRKSFRSAIASLNDHHAYDMDTSDCKMHLISFKSLFDIFSQSIHTEEKMLLFYLILIENESFRVFVLSRTDQETIYLPILKLLYESIEGKTNYCQLYVLITILLILSQDDVNNEAIQKIIVHNITWFTERPLLKSISLGGLMTLVLIRTLQLNLSHQKDIYIHTTCLGILLNMSSAMSEMHAYVAQRIVSLFELLSKRHMKLKEEEDMVVYEDLLCLLLEIINSILTYKLKHNIQLIYALLLKPDLFTHLEHYPRLSELIENIELVINYFNDRVAEANLRAPSSNEVLKLIEQASRTWPLHKLTILPCLKFQFHEEEVSYEFFIPYIWALIQRKSFIYWSEDTCHLLENYQWMNMEA
ncbi:Dymeclin [Pilobolus umbonatus]|nr:Dymeclin [Pilobolus umbonatus]